MSVLSLHKKCLDAILSEIQGMDLTGIDDASVHLLPVPTNRSADIGGSDRSITYPCIVVAPFGVETIGGPENQADDITYPCVVVIVDKSETALANLDRNLYWRERLIDWFHENRFPAISNSSHSVVQPLAIVDDRLFMNDKVWSSAILVNITCTKQRRIS